MRSKNWKLRRAMSASVLGATLFWATASFAQYSFWEGTELKQETMQDPNDPSKTLITRPGLTQEQLNAIETAIRANMPDLNTFTNNPFQDRGLTLWDSTKTWSGYTLLTLLQGYVAPDGKTYGAILIDMDGTVVRMWELMGLAKMLPNGSIMGGAGRSTELVGWPYLVQKNWCGKDEWVFKGAVEYAWPAERSWVFPPANGRCSGAYPEAPYDAVTNPLGCRNPVLPGDMIVSGWHHDYQREGNPVGYYFPGAQGTTKVNGGRTLVLAHYIPPLSETCPDPADAQTCISKYRLYDEGIYIVDWQGKTEFAWFPYEHFDEMGFRPEARQAIRETANLFNNERATDYQHFNNVDWVGKNKWWDAGDLRFNPDYIVWDARQSNITAIIATADHPKGEWKAGDIVWRMGPDFQDPTRPESALGPIIGVHMAHFIPKGLPGAGNMLVFDNGGGAGWGPLFAGAAPPYLPDDPLYSEGPGPFGGMFAHPSRKSVNSMMRNYSRVIEFDPRTFQIKWQYAQPRPTYDYDGDGNTLGNERLFFSFFISSAQRLHNGNTLVTEGAMGRVFEVTPTNEVVWEYVNPFKGGGLGVPESVGTVYRAYRVPYDWAPKDKSCD